MALVEYTNIKDGDSADANVWNSRYADLLEQLNGNLDRTNIKNGSLTRELFATDALLAAWPIGSIHISVSPTNPGSTLGGSWVPFGTGKTIVGIDTADTDFNEAEKQFGAKTVTLTEGQMPSHNHSGSTSASGDHVHGFPRDVLVTSGSGSARVGSAGGQQVAWSQMGTTNGGGNHAHNFTTDARGGNAAHSNVQPSIVVYMWKRIS